MEWVRGPRDALPIDAVMENGLLRFRASSKDQEGYYECTGTSETGSVRGAAYLYVEGIINISLFTVEAS